MTNNLYKESITRTGCIFSWQSIFVIFCVAILMIVLLFSWNENWFDLSSFMLIFVSCMIAGSTAILAFRSSHLFSLFLVGFLLRVLLAIGVYYYLANYYGFRGFEGNDDLYWDTTAKAILSGRIGWDQALRESFSAGFSLLTALIYKFAGLNPLGPRIVNSMFGALIPIVSYWLTLELFYDFKLARRVAVWLVFLPVLLFWSTAFQKDILICLCMTIGVYACIRLYKRNINIWSLIMLSASVILMSLLRTFAVYILILSGFFAVVYRAKRSGFVSGVAVAMLFVLFSVAIGVLLSKVIGRHETFDLQGELTNRAASFEKSSQRLASGQGVSSLLTAAPRPVRLVIGPVITILSPVPPGFAWKRNFSYSYMSLFQPLQLWFFPFLVLGGIRAIRSSQARVDGVPLLLPAIVIALIANSFYAVGQITKYRIMIEPLLILIVVWAHYSSTSATRKICLVAAVGTAFLALFGYFVLRSFL
ncbi:MAG: hypothetical protein EOL98_09500 [Negativicutes bacterium]|nr:hypothetical protein [Negativicutes bacterium]